MSTVHAALELTESIYNSIDSKQHCAGVFIDLKKAFDTVNHKLTLLVEQQSFYGVGRDGKYMVRKLSNLLLNLKDSYFEPAVGSPPNFARMCGYRPY